MYTEVKELVNFLCRYIHGRIPRRPIGIFGAELGNYLVSRYASCHWDPVHPKNGEETRVVCINAPNGSSPCFESSANESGLDIHEILSLFPQNMYLYCNPGEVFARLNGSGIAMPIWSGSVNADENYQAMPEHIVSTASTVAAHSLNSNLGAAGQSVYIGKKPLPTENLAVLELVSMIFVPLGRELIEHANCAIPHFQMKYPFRFVFKPTSAQTYTGAEFSVTRFGSSKPRPDLTTMLSIKQQSSGSQAISSASSSTPSLEHAQNRQPQIMRTNLEKENNWNVPGAELEQCQTAYSSQKRTTWSLDVNVRLRIVCGKKNDDVSKRKEKDERIQHEDGVAEVIADSKMSGKLEIISLEEFDEPFEEILKSEAEEAERNAEKYFSMDSWETVSSIGVNVSYSNAF
ncbi:unnamed protein product [Caenorhabditis sp. 36 PRJEB53466]|nr:unnamed protein product [Caenorhabditis sp. 36 PRJEB53466]